MSHRGGHPGRWILGATLVVAAAVAVLVGPGEAPARAQDDPVARGRELYLVGCVSCHGVDGVGVDDVGGGERGPDITDSGAAGAYYMLSTGRMPLNNPDEQSHRKEPAYDEEEIADLVAYVASLGDGPALPEVSIDGADVAAGGTIFRANCQACHAASGSGGALSYGRAAPSLGDSRPRQVAAAVRVGPGQMPVFGPTEIPDDELADLAAYVDYLRNPEDPGGLPLGRIGPVPEGFVAWSVGVVLLLACVFWIGTRAPARRRSRS